MLRRACLLLTAGLAACAHAARLPAPIPPAKGTPRTAYAMRVLDVAAGTGAPAGPRQCYYVHYTGWLTDGRKFDSSRDTAPDGRPRGPFAFAQGARMVIPGWDGSFEGMRVGARRRLFIPYQLAYGALGRAPRIPARAALIFDVELLAVADTLPRAAPTAPRPGRGVVYPQCPDWSAVRAAGGGEEGRGFG